MKTYIIAIRDIVADVYTQPFTSASIGGTIREFGDRCNGTDAQDMVAKHPEHFELWLLGEYDDKNGSIRSFSMDSAGEEPRQLAAGANLKISRQ